MTSRVFSVGRFLILLFCIMTLVLAAVLVNQLQLAVRQHEQAKAIRFMTVVSNQLFRSMQALRLDRGYVNTALTAPAPADWCSAWGWGSPDCRWSISG